MKKNRVRLLIGMDVFKQREQHLKDMIDALISDIENDYFIPQMLNHQKSADFIPERIEELFVDHIEHEFEQFQDYVECSIDSVMTETKTSSLLLDQDKFSLNRSMNLLKLQNDHIKMDVDVNNSRLSTVKQQGKKSIDEINQKTKDIENYITLILKNSAKLRISIQKFEAQCLSERNLFEEYIKAQKFELNQAFENLKAQIDSYIDDYKLVKSDSKPKIEKQINKYQQLNSTMKNAMNRLLYIFDGKVNNINDIQHQISTYLKKIHRPIVFKDRHISSDSIKHTIDMYLKQKDFESHQKLIEIEEEEKKMKKDISTFYDRIQSPLNLRAIYESRRKKNTSSSSGLHESLRFD